MKNRSIIIIAVTAAVAFIAVAAAAAVLISRGGSGNGYNEHLELADRYLEELEYEQAIAELRTAIEIEPGRSDAYLALSEVYAAMNDYENALAALQAGYEATGDGVFPERMAELEPLGQEYENQNAEAGQEQPGAAAGNTDRQEAGTEGTDSAEAGAGDANSGQTGMAAEAQLRLQPVFDSLVLFGEPLTPENSWQDICDRWNIENMGEITDEDTLWEVTGNPLQLGEGIEGTECDVIVWTWDDLDIFDYHYSYRIRYTDSSPGDYSGSTEIQYLPDGQLYGIQTDAYGAGRETDYTALEGFAGYLYENQITSLADFLRSIGVEEAEPRWITVAEGFFNAEGRNEEIQYYWTEHGTRSVDEAVYETEYGPVTLSFQNWSDLGYLMVDFYIIFEEDAPWGILKLREFVDSAGVHRIIMGAFVEESPLYVRW